jgi:hypothetical protein
MERRLTRFAAPVSLFIRENADNKLAPNAAAFCSSTQLGAAVTSPEKGKFRAGAVVAMTANGAAGVALPPCVVWRVPLAVPKLTQ